MKFLSYLIGVLLGVIVLLGAALWIFVAPLFQADELLAQIRIEEELENRCYLISLELTSETNTGQPKIVISHQPICGDFLGLGYEFALPDKRFFLMKKPGIVITNIVAFDKRTRNQTGNILVGSYKIEFLETVRTQMAQLLKLTSAFKQVTYDVKALMKKPKKGAIIAYKLEPFRQQVIVACTGCEE